jgi:Fe-S cluster assembly protein SufD
MTTLGENARYRAFQLTAATGLARNSVFALFEGEGAKLDISGAFLGRGSEHIDTTLVVDHAVPGGESRELFKGVLADRARGVFQGKVIVRPNAQKTDGKQMAQALLLSPDAEFDSKPELEIFADDVVCGHGSTSAEIDEDLLFYMLSRGIPRGEARALLIESFIGEAIDKVEDESLREALSAMAKSRLAALSAVRD